MSAVRGLRAAIGFLTRIPVGRIDPPDAGLSRSTMWYPLVGAIVAAVGVATWWVGTTTLGPAAGAVLSVVATVLVTGAFHEDGLADTADGLWGGATVDRRLEIMRDSRMGTYGIVALISDLLLRVAILLAFGAGDLADVARVLVAGHVVGRASPLVLELALPQVRPDSKSAHLYPVGPAGMAVANGTVGVAVVACTGWWAPVVLAAAVVPVLAVRGVAKRRIGGITGDMFGAGVALTNLTVTAVVAGLAREGLL